MSEKIETYTKENPPKPGDSVTINDKGLHLIGGLKNELEISQINNIQIVSVNFEITDGVWDITLTQPFSKYMIHSEGINKLT